MSESSDQAIVASLWPDTKTTVSEHYFCEKRPFAIPQAGNKATINRDGEQAFSRIYDAIDAATTFVFIIDWQLSIDFELKRPKPGAAADESHPYRLSELLARKVMAGVDVRILIFDAFWFTEDDIPTYDDSVARILNDLGAQLKKAGAPGSLVCIQHDPTSTQIDQHDYSHHQKMVLVDGKVGFLGGMDMTNGRWDTIEFDCVVNPARYVINDMYNPCLVRARKMSASERKLTQPALGGAAKALRIKGADLKSPGFALPQYDGKKGRLLEQGCQPRMPWQDVHVMLEGPALADMYRNFVRRLDGYIVLSDAFGGYVNAADSSPEQKQYRQKLKKLQTPQSLLDKWRDAVAANATPKGNAHVQIVRSVSNRQLQGEAYRLDDLKLHTRPGAAKAWEEAVMAWKGEHQDNIYQAMLACIRAAKAYIYIETQFLISAHGGLSEAMIDNQIVDALAGKIIDMHHQGIPFHVYIVLPVHPEGPPTNEATYKQQRLALNSVAHGSSSLFHKVEQATGKQGTNFVTVLNLRTHGVVVHYARDPKTGEQLLDQEIGRYVVTEQIYVHSKLLIVDDAVAIIGSANTNDRSLTGNGDSEIAAVIVDSEDVRFEDLGNGNKVHTRKFARELRTALWRKHLGMDLPMPGNEAAAMYYPADFLAEYNKERPQGVPRVPHPPRHRLAIAGQDQWLLKPAASSTWTGIKARAKANTKVYEEVFPGIPSNRLPKFDSGLLFYPTPVRAGAETAEQFRARQNQVHEDLFKRQGLSGSQLETARTNARRRIDELAKTASRNHAGEDSSMADLAGIPPILSQIYMRPMHDFQRKLPGYSSYKVSFDGGVPAQLVHHCEAAVEELRNRIAGFWVEAPLEWGQGQTVLNPYTAGPGVDITMNNIESLGRPYRTAGLLQDQEIAG
jgi:phospholipase D1/2